MRLQRRARWAPTAALLSPQASDDTVATVRATSEAWLFDAVTPAGSGQEALEILRKSQSGTFQLVLTVRRCGICSRYVYRGVPGSQHVMNRPAGGRGRVCSC